eukprot:9030136-Pyramimonas_sp.AAC.1
MRIRRATQCDPVPPARAQNPQDLEAHGRQQFAPHDPSHGRSSVRPPPSADQIPYHSHLERLPGACCRHGLSERCRGYHGLVCPGIARLLEEGPQAG